MTRRFERDRIHIEGADVGLVVGDRLRDSARLDDIERLYVVWLADPLTQGDEPFFVAVLSNRLWVIPEDSTNLQPFLQAVVPRLAASQQVVEVVTNGMPIRWRARALGLPLFPRPRLAMQAPPSFPSWNELPVSPQRLAQVTGVAL